jgi:hypothetical protein
MIEKSTFGANHNAARRAEQVQLLIRVDRARFLRVLSPAAVAPALGGGALQLVHRHQRMLDRRALPQVH